MSFVKNNCALNQDAYLNGCILKQEIIVIPPQKKSQGMTNIVGLTFSVGYITSQLIITTPSVSK